jgi:hypothetical protein
MGAARLRFGLPSGWQRDAGPVGQQLQGFPKPDPLAFHHETERVAAQVAHPAFPRLALGIDLEAGFRIIMPGTEAHEDPALSAQGQIATDQIDDVRRLADAILQVFVLRGCEGHRGVLWRLACGKEHARPRPECHVPETISLPLVLGQPAVKCYP